jgi:hypothetical protein
VLAWIQKFGATENARHIYRAWLDAGGQRDLIDKDVLGWIELFGATEGAQFVYKGWLSAGGDFETISEPCLAWFNAHSNSYEASHLIKYIAKREDLPTASLHAAIKWCGLFARSEESVWRAVSLLSGYAGHPEVTAVVRAFLICIRFFDVDRLATSPADGSLEEDRSMLSSVLLRGLGHSLNVLTLDDVDRRELMVAHAKLLLESQIYVAGHIDEPLALPSLIHHVAELIERGLVDPVRDRLALTRFADWMRAWPKDAYYDLGLAISRLRSVAPLDLWDRIPLRRQCRQAAPRTPQPQAKPFSWRSDWRIQWNAAQDDRSLQTELAREAVEWLDRFDCTQPGWTYIWKILWNVSDETLVSREEVVELAIRWLGVADACHPRWAYVWGEIWNAAETGQDTKDLLSRYGRAWLEGEERRIEWDLVWSSLWRQPEFRDEVMSECAYRRMKLAPDLDYEAIKSQLAT